MPGSFDSPSGWRAKTLHLFPRPQRLTVPDWERESFIPSGISWRAGKAPEPELELVKTWCRSENSAPWQKKSRGSGRPGMLELRLERRAASDTLYLSERSRLSPEAYRLEISAESEGFTAAVTYGALPGLRHALSTLSLLLGWGGIIPCVIEDFPDFPVRGIIEGFYGPPWSREERIGMMRLLSRYKMNTYVYGPKDDPFHRERWREPYGEESLRNLKELVDEAAACGLDFWYSVGPGLSMCYSRRSGVQSAGRDIEALERKLLQVQDLGVRTFGLFLDDIPERLQYPEDRESFEDLVSAHISLCSELFSSLSQRGAGLCVCPTQYHGRGNEYYISRLGQELDPLIDILWTGPEICSPELTLEDAALFRQATLHKPLYWDNYPVNDLEMSSEMHIGPYLGRDPYLHRFSRGVIANGMEYPEASKIPFITIASSLWNSSGYDPESAFAHAAGVVAGEGDAQAFLLFAENVRSSCLCPADALGIARALEDFRFAYSFGDREEGFRELFARLEPYRGAAESLSSGFENKKLGDEVARWVRKYSAGIELLWKTLESLRNGCRAEGKDIEAEYNEYMKDGTRVFADVVYPFIAEVLRGFAGDAR